MFNAEEVPSLAGEGLEDPGLSSLHLPVQIRGADALELPLGSDVEADRFVSDSVEQGVGLVSDHEVLDVHLNLAVEGKDEEGGKPPPPSSVFIRFARSRRVSELV